MAALAREVGSQEEAVRLVDSWRAVERTLREEVEAALPSPDELVLAGLERAGRAHLLSAAERSQLDEGRPSIERAETAISAVVDVIRSVGRDAEAFDAAWSRAFVSAPARRGRPARRPVPLRRVVSRFAMAATVVAFAVVSVLLLQRDTRPVTVAVSEGVRVVNLDDGSRVRLLAGATIEYADGPFDRRVTLDGKAYFSVRESAVPFQVVTPSATVTVLGTTFGVDAEANATHVVLVTGRVAVASPDAPDDLVVLEPGQRTRIDRGAPPIPPQAADLGSELGWTRILFFRSTPVSDVVSSLETQYGITITVHESLAGERVTGTFEPDRPVADVLQIVATALQARIEWTGSGEARILP